MGWDEAKFRLKHYANMSDKDIGRATPRNNKIMLERVDGFILTEALTDYLKAGGEPRQLKGALREKYVELYSPPVIKRTEGKNDPGIFKLHQDLKDGKITMNDILKGAH